MVKRKATKAAARKPRAGKNGASRGPHRWAPGQSGNPLGRVPDEELANAREAARRLILPHAQDLVQTLVDIANRGKSERARIHAAEALLDRLYGKAPQSVEVTGKDGGPVGQIIVRLVKPGEDGVSA